MAEPRERPAEAIRSNEAILARLDAMDKAVALLQEQANRSPTINEVFKQSMEKFEAIEQQFDLVERQRVEQKIDTKEAVNAALVAQKDAVKEQTTASERAIAKSEAAVSKGIDQLGLLQQTNTKAMEDKINDLKERITLMEGRSRGIGDSYGVVVGIVGAVAGVVGIIAAVAAIFSHRGAP